jgi:hypothetical protein
MGVWWPIRADSRMARIRRYQVRMLRLNWLGGGLLGMIALAAALEIIKRDPGWMLACWVTLVLLSGLLVGYGSVNFQHAVTLMRTRGSEFQLPPRGRNSPPPPDVDHGPTPRTVRVRPDRFGRWPRSAEKAYSVAGAMVLFTGSVLVFLCWFGAAINPSESRAATNPSPVVVNFNGLNTGQSPGTQGQGSPSGPTSGESSGFHGFRQFSGPTTTPGSPTSAGSWEPMSLIIVSLVAVGLFLALRPKESDRFVKWVKRFSAATAAIIAAATGFLGVLGKYYEVRTAGRADRVEHSPSSSEQRTLFLDLGGMSVATPSPEGSAATAFLFSFPEEGHCGKGPAEDWVGIRPSPEMVAELTYLSRSFSSCSTAAKPVHIEEWGFASSADVKNFGSCSFGDLDTNHTTTERAASSNDANKIIAEARAKAVDLAMSQLLANSVVHNYHRWKSFEEMERSRGFLDKVISGASSQYSPQRGALNRRVEVRILDLGTCDIRPIQNTQPKDAS